MIFSRVVATVLAAFLAFTRALPAQENFIKAEFITLSWKSNIKDLWFMSQEGPPEAGCV